MKKLILAIPLFFCLSIAKACPDIDSLVDINCDGKLVIAGFGDSITFGRADTPEGVGYPGRLREVFPNATVRNLGNPGENSFDGRSRAAFQFPNIGNVDYAIVLEGVNDFFLPELDSFATRDNIFTISQIAKNTGAISLIANLTDILRPDQKNWVLSVNNRIQSFKQIDFFSLGTGILSSDLLHPDKEGYDAMTDLLVPILRATSEQNRPIDSDNDNLYDFAESRFGTDIFNPDSDNDGLLDGDEVFSFGSSPLLLDTDGDSLSDPQEVEIGSNPASAAPSAPVLRSIEIL